MRFRFAFRAEALHCGYGEQPINQTKSERSCQSSLLSESTLYEDLGAIISDYVYTTELLEEEISKGYECF